MSMATWSRKMLYNGKEGLKTDRDETTSKKACRKPAGNSRRLKREKIWYNVVY